jgi:S-formylglutathione hydrolase FrmB
LYRSCRNFIDKAGAFAAAVKYKVFIVCPDTSPRGVDIEGDSESWDFGKGAGFYVNATEPKWKDNYRLLHVDNRTQAAIILEISCLHVQPNSTIW